MGYDIKFDEKNIPLVYNYIIFLNKTIEIQNYKTKAFFTESLKEPCIHHTQSPYHTDSLLQRKRCSSFKSGDYFFFVLESEIFNIIFLIKIFCFVV